MVANEAAILRDAGHDVIQHVAENPQGSIQATLALGLSSWNPLAAKRMSALVSRHRPDITHVHNTWYQLSTSVLSAIRSAGSPLAVTMHNYRSVCANALLLRDGVPCELCIVTRSSRPAIAHRCYRNSVLASSAAAAAIATSKATRVWHEGPDLLIAVSEFLQSKLIQGGLPENKMVVKHHFAADPGVRSCAPSESKTVLYVGRLSPEKGIDLLLKAWAREKRHDLVLQVVGEGPPGSPARDEAGPTVEILGRVDAHFLRAKMLSARALIMPSQCYESFGMVLVEAMAAGLPVIASKIGAIPEVLGPWPSELLVTPGSVDSLTGALDILADGPLLDRAGTHGRKRYEALFTPARGLTALEETYARAAAAHY